MGHLTEIGRFTIPNKYRPHFRQYLLKAGYKEVPYNLFGMLFYLLIFIAAMIYFIFLFPYFTENYGNAMGIGFFTFISFFGLTIGLAVITMSAIYFYLDLKIFHRTKEMERVLVEFLQFVGENLKGGMSFDKALWKSVRPEFTVLADEVKIAAKKTMTGEDVENALGDLATKYDSALMKRSFTLIVEGMKGGGQIASIIDRVVENLKETRSLKEEMNAQVLSYVIFITFVVIIISPGLFALAKQLLVILGGFAEELGGSLGGGGSAVPISFSGVSVTPEDFTIFSRSAMGVICMFSSMILSIIQRGNVKGGIKYVPLFIVVALILYSVFNFMLTGLMSVFI